MGLVVLMFGCYPSLPNDPKNSTTSLRLHFIITCLHVDWKDLT